MNGGARVVIGHGFTGTATPDEVRAALATAVRAARCTHRVCTAVARIELQA